MIEKISDQSLTVKDISGTTVPLASLINGKRVLAVNFWATWCAPCRKEVSHLVSLYNQHNKDGFSIFGLTLEPLETSKAKVDAYIRKESVSYPIYFASREVYHLFNGTEKGQPTYIPLLLLYNREGRMDKNFNKLYGGRSKTEQRKARETMLE
jgi:thiol-disulfide isomerase/thioredoxin